MRLKVGELAKRSGLTVRTLHHYHAIGLLTPSARADNGYRLYGRDDIARLHQIQALRRFGLPLAEIGAYLDQPGTPLDEIIARQIAMLDSQIQHATRLRERLAQLQGQLAMGAEPELADWLTTLELMNMYDKYFSQEELARLPMYRRGPNDDAGWLALIADVRRQMDDGAPPEDPRSQALALRWMTLLLRDTNGDPRLLVKLNQMHEREPAMQEHIGISPAMRDYIVRAFSESKLRLYEKHLTPDEARFMRAHYHDRAGEWPALMARVRDAIDAGQAPDSAAGRELARQWLELFCSYAGNDPATHAKFRHALMTEPELTAGTWADDATLAFMRQAMGALTAARYAASASADTDADAVTVEVAATVAAATALPARRLDEIHEGAQRRRQIMPARKIQQGAGEAWPPIRQHRLQFAPIQVRPQPVLEQVDHPGARHRRIDRQVHRRPQADDQRTIHLHRDGLAVAFKRPRRHRAAGETAAQAQVLAQVLRMPRLSMPGQIPRRGGRRHPLAPRPDRDGHHVLVHAFLVADAGIAARLQQLDKTIVDDDLQPDLRILRQERRHDARQHQPGRRQRHIQPQPARRPVTETVGHVQRRLDRVQRGRQLLQQALPGRRGRHAARGAVQQPQAQPGFQPAHRFAQLRRAGPRLARRAAKAPMRGHRHKGADVLKVGHGGSRLFDIPHKLCDYQGLSHAARRPRLASFPPWSTS